MENEMERCVKPRSGWWGEAAIIVLILVLGAALTWFAGGCTLQDTRNGKIRSIIIPPLTVMTGCTDKTTPAPATVRRAMPPLASVETETMLNVSQLQAEVNALRVRIEMLESQVQKLASTRS